MKMSSFLCFLCHSTVNADTHEEMREKYREVVGMNLCPDSHLCFICCHVLNRLWLFKAVCLKRSLEYPVLFSEKGTLNLQRSDGEIYSICSEDSCEYFNNGNINSKIYTFKQVDETYENYEKDDVNNDYVQLHEDREFDDYFNYKDGGNDGIEDNYNVGDANCKFTNANSFYDDFNSDYGNMKQADAPDGINDECINKFVDSGYEIDSEVVSTQAAIVEIEDNPQFNAETDNVKKKSKKIKKKFEKIILSLEEQKAELEGNRRSKNYLEAEFKCSNCAMGFLFKDTYQTHMMRHEESNGEYRCGICTLRFASPSVLRAHLCVHGERYRCLRCGDMLKKRQRVAHTATCYGEKPDTASCHLCGKEFSNGSGLQQHLKRFHHSQSTRRYACGVCGKRCANSAAVRTHMIKHIQKKFPCDACPSTFSSPYTLKQHKKKHSGSPPTFPCITCGTAYTSRKNLLAHHRNVHQKERVSCPKCGTVCNSKRALTTHLLGHSGLQARPRPAGRKARQLAVCYLCGATFKGNNKLNRHLREVCEKNKLEEQLSAFYDQESMLV
ncbi:hypothetical protein ACJJTC_015223 [Scirpophaga incertulas]